MKWRCLNCESIIENGTLFLRAPNPFNPTDEVLGCPHCKAIADIADALCDEPGCELLVTCGTPTPTGYRHTCSKHAPK